MAFQKQTLHVFLFFGSYLLADPAGIWQSAGLLLTNAKSCFSGSHKSGDAGNSRCAAMLPGRLGVRARVSGLQGLQGKRLSTQIRMKFIQWPLLLGVCLNVLYSSEYFRGSTKHDRVCEFYLGLRMSGLLFCQWDENAPPSRAL